MSIETESIPVVLIPRELSKQTLLQFEESLEEVINRSPARLDLDCSGLGLVSSSHVNVLWSARERCEAAGISVRLTRASTCLVRILKVLDLEEFFPRDDTVTDSENQLCGKPTGALNDRTLELSVKCSSEDTLDALHQFREYLKTLRVDPMCAIELETVFYETLTNIRVHGKLDENATIEFTAVADLVAVEMTFVDSGHPFNPTEHVRSFDPETAIQCRQKHGFGLTMISRMTDYMDYRREDDARNVLKLKKFWK